MIRDHALASALITRPTFDKCSPLFPTLIRGPSLENEWAAAWKSTVTTFPGAPPPTLIIAEKLSRDAILRCGLGAVSVNA